MSVAQLERQDEVVTGKTLPPFELTGADGCPVVLTLGGISADKHVHAHDGDPRPGWWERVVGPGRAIDTTAFRILGIDFGDGGDRDDGRPSRIITTHDQADLIAALLDSLGITRLHALIGASYGGMVGLAFAERHPELLEQLVVIGAAHRAHALTTAWRVVQRRIVELGLETGRAEEAMAIARALAMTTYRSREEFAARFGATTIATGDADATFPVESYLRHHGEKFAQRFSAARFLALSLSSDLHAVDPSAITTPTTLVAEAGDLIVPREDVLALASAFAGPCDVVELESIHGHDAFLLEPERLGNILQPVLHTSSHHD
jgi:homoserine O-acetyltransferase